jgi:hypothetical protein
MSLFATGSYRCDVAQCTHCDIEGISISNRQVVFVGRLGVIFIKFQYDIMLHKVAEILKIIIHAHNFTSEG